MSDILINILYGIAILWGCALAVGAFAGLVYAGAAFMEWTLDHEIASWVALAFLITLLGVALGVAIAWTS